MSLCTEIVIMVFFGKDEVDIFLMMLPHLQGSREICQISVVYAIQCIILMDYPAVQLLLYFRSKVYDVRYIILELSI